MRRFLVFLCLLFFTEISFSEVVEFSEQELPTESVTPVFEDVVMVKKRRVSLARSFQVEVGGSFFPKEPFFSCCETPSFYGSLGYYFNETHGINLQLIYYTPGVGKYGKVLEEKKFKGSVGISPSNMPQPLYSAFLNYEPVIYYGKISLTKNGVMNLSLFGIMGGGVLAYKDGVYFPSVNLGVGKKLYFTKHIGLRLGLSLLSYESIDLGTKGSLQDKRFIADYETKWYFIQQVVISLGLVGVF